MELSISDENERTSYRSYCELTKTKREVLYEIMLEALKKSV
jgi:hypothetical protein